MIGFTTPVGKSGPVTSFRINGLDELWRPFQLEPASSVSRRLAKSTTSDAVIFEEDHASQPLTFSYRWSSCEEFGFVRRARIVNRGESEFQISLVDGLVNLLPCGVDPALDLSMRNLTNAYKRSEQVSEAFSVVVYSMESQVSDRPHPLKCSVRTLCGQTALRISISHWTPRCSKILKGAHHRVSRK